MNKDVSTPYIRIIQHSNVFLQVFCSDDCGLIELELIMLDVGGACKHV